MVLVGAALSQPRALRGPFQAEVAAQADQNLERFFDRERRIGFTPASGRAAAIALEESGDPAVRARALMALGIVGSVANRPALERATRSTIEVERCAAVLGLGELGNRVANADILLAELLEDPSRRVAECALYSLMRTRPEVGLARAEVFAGDPTHPLNPIAPVLVDWLNGRPSIGAEPALRRLTLRWEAARSFGTVDGLSWRMQRVERLGTSQVLLDRLVLLGAAELDRPEVRDYILELLIEPGPRPIIVRAAVTAMAEELDQLIVNGLWAPRSPEEWEALVDEAERLGLFRLLPNALERAAQVESLLARVAPHLAITDTRFRDVVEGLLESGDASRRKQVAFGIGEANLGQMLSKLNVLRDDPSTAVRASAALARARLGDTEVLSELFSLFVEERDLERNNGQERGFVLDAMYKTRRSRVTQSLVEGLADSLRDATTLAERKERAALLAIRRLGGHTVDAEQLLEFYGDESIPAHHQIWLIEALGEVPQTAVKKRLAADFPAEGGWRQNLPLIRALLQGNAESVVPVLHAAVWQGPQQRSILAAALVQEHYGINRLMHWVAKPPAGASQSDLRRVGFAVGTLGRLGAVESLKKQLGAVAGAERPALQGALLGALAARTR